jgi:hypothetical protein
MSRREWALAIARVARWLLPRGRGEWAEAMEAELYYVDDEEAVRWALGYLVANSRERIRAMKIEMTARQARRLNLALALVFAGLMLVVSYAMKGSPEVWTVIGLLTAVWMVPFGYLSQREASGCGRARGSAA